MSAGLPRSLPVWIWGEDVGKGVGQRLSSAPLSCSIHTFAVGGGKESLEQARGAARGGGHGGLEGWVLPAPCLGAE